MPIPMPAAVLAGGESRRMGRPKAALPWGAGTLAEHQTGRLARLFEEVWLVVKEEPDWAAGPARVLLDGVAAPAAVHGLRRALAEARDRVFVLAVDLPALAETVLREIARRGLATACAAVVPEAGGRLQPLAAVWRRETLAELDRRLARGELSLHGLAQAVGAEIVPESEWRTFDPSGNSFVNANTLREYAELRERA
ncbi:MAG TPA: molybdenum cofactor guanylyltransferase [Thermoanaerobaculia bacterium]